MKKYLFIFAFSFVFCSNQSSAYEDIRRLENPPRQIPTIYLEERIKNGEIVPSQKDKTKYSSKQNIR
jgi:hypothetical protein